MIELKFLCVPYDPTKEREDLIRQAAFELNNLLAIPMKIVDLEVGPASTPNYHNVNINVEDCADEKEWDDLVKAFVAGVQFGGKSMQLNYKEVKQKNEQQITKN